RAPPATSVPTPAGVDPRGSARERLQQLPQLLLLGAVELADARLQLVDALLLGQPVELCDDVLEFLAPLGGVAGQVLAGELLQGDTVLTVCEVLEQGAGGDVGTRADQGDQFGEQLHAGLTQ